MRPCGCLPSYIFLGQNCVKFYEVTKRPRLIQLAQGEPAGGVREGGLASQPAQLQPFGLFSEGRL
jgi:hypothetical protein